MLFHLFSPVSPSPYPCSPASRLTSLHLGPPDALEALNPDSEHTFICHQYPLPLPLSHLHPVYRPGELHLVPCTLEQYFQLPLTKDNFYDPHDGILFWRDDMAPATKQHDDIRDSIAQMLRNAIRYSGLLEQYQVKVVRSFDASGCAENGLSANERYSASVLHSDIMVVTCETEHARSHLSPCSQKITATRGYPPRMCVEITSTEQSRNIDFSTKKRNYAECNVEEYIIIDLNLPSPHNPSVQVCQLHRNRRRSYYSRTSYREDETIRFFLLDYPPELVPSQLMTC